MHPRTCSTKPSLGACRPAALAQLATALFVTSVINSASAEVALYSGERLTIGATIEVGAGYFHTENTNFGTGRVDAVTGENTGDAKWTEGYFEPAINGEYKLGGQGSLYGGASIVGATTGGDGDASGLTDGGDGELGLEALFLGWRSGDTFAGSLGENAVDASYGRQEFQVGDGFLIYDGNLDAFDEGAFWLAPRASFERAGLIRFNTEPLRGDLFYLKAADNQDDAELAGINVEYVQEGIGTLGAMYFHVLDSDAPEMFAPRDGVDVISLRANEISFPGMPELRFWGEYARQTGEGKYGEKDAKGWYLEGQYSLSDIAWAPRFSYRYAHFSGDTDPTDNVSKDFDPFFYGFSRGWGTWFQGEVAGNYLLFNSNQANHMFHLAASPTESVEVGAIYYDFALDKKNYFGTPVSNDDFGDEFNLYLDWSINDNLSASAVYGVFRPGQAAEDAFGDDDKFHLFQVFLIYSL